MGGRTTTERGRATAAALLLRRTLPALALAWSATTVSGAAVAAPAPSGPPLVVAVDFVVPEYQGGSERFRTPATLDTALAADLARRFGRPLVTVGPRAPAGPAPDLRITTLDDPKTIPPATQPIVLDYRAAPMAIMRTDSDLRRWEQLAGRSVCVAAGGNHVGDLERRYGATEIVYPSLTDALVAVRVGDCDAVVHDSPMLERLIQLPEWKKFSRRLPPRPATSLAVLAPADDPDLASRAQRVAEDWKAAGFTRELLDNAVRNLAFEVYLQQEVPDCH